VPLKGSSETIVDPFGGVNAVTNLASWYAYNDARYETPGLSKADEQRISNYFFLPNMDVIPSGKLTFKYARTPIFWEAVWTFLFVEMFDSFGTLTGIMTRAGFMKGDPEKAMTRVNRAMCVDGFGLWLGAIIGSNSITCYIESNTGVEAGARTGLASIVTGSAFLLSLLFIAPFVASASTLPQRAPRTHARTHARTRTRPVFFLTFPSSCPPSLSRAQSSRMRPPCARSSWLACTAWRVCLRSTLRTFATCCPRFSQS
jgi:hypothetical protein